MRIEDFFPPAAQINVTVPLQCLVKDSQLITNAYSKVARLLFFPLPQTPPPILSGMSNALSDCIHIHDHLPLYFFSLLSLSKSGLVGFYDPIPDEPKVSAWHYGNHDVDIGLSAALRFFFT